MLPRLSVYLLMAEKKLGIILAFFYLPYLLFFTKPFQFFFVSDLTTCLNLSCPCHLLLYPQDGSNLTGLPLHGFSVSFQDPFPIMQPESFKNENLIVILPFLCFLITSHSSEIFSRALVGVLSVFSHILHLTLPL